MSRKKHIAGCNCPVCNNNIREERQYAAFEAEKGVYRTVDVEEIVHINDYFSLRNKGNNKLPEYPRIYPEDDAKPVIAYGAIIPQYDNPIRNWQKEFNRNKQFTFGTLLHENIYVSGYTDFSIYEDDKVYNTHIPIALLLYSSLDLSKTRDYGFGYTAFLVFKDMDILTNILNRQYLLSLGGIESSFDGIGVSNWKNYIDKSILIDIANRLF